MNDYSIMKELKRLKSIRGSGTELISVYIPSGFQLNEEISKLREEYSQSSNIKSKSTRTNVLGAIDKIIQYLRLYKHTPKNGLAIFCGNISDNPSKTTIEIFSVEPPTPLGVNIYRCDSTFMLEPLEMILSNQESYCILTMDGREATIGLLKGSHIQVVRRLNSTAHAKVRKGGQSAQRYERAIEESIHDYVKRISESINDVYVQNNFKIKGLLVGGPGPAKEGFLKAHTLNYQIKILGTFDVGYTDEFGLHEVVEKAAELMKEEEAAKERKILERFISERVRNGLAAAGYEETKNALANKQVETLIISNEIQLHKVTYRCPKDGSVFERFEYGDIRLQKHDCGTNLAIEKTEDAAEELIDIAESSNVPIFFASSDSSLGKEFLMGFKGIGAILRYK